MTEGPSEEDRGGTDTTNYAGDNARVEAQIGVVHGDVSFYTLHERDTPEDKYRVGRNYLEGNMPREAEKLIREAFMAGYRSNELLYYWSLAVLSNRSFDHLSESDFDQLSSAFAEVERRESDEWLTALGVVAQLVQSLIAQEEQIEADLEEFDAALRLYGELPAPRRDEVRRHLEMMLVGGIQDQLEARDAAEIAHRRMSENRRDRVWQFFEPKPEPARRLPPPDGEQRPRDLALVTGGCALALVIVYFGYEYVVGGSVPLFVVSLLLYGGGAYLLARYGVEWRVVAAKADWAKARLNGRIPDGKAFAPWRLEDSGRSMAFAGSVTRLLDIRFREHLPSNGRDPSTWIHESAGLRATLAREITEQYSESSPLPRIAALDWLARFHADTVFAEWEKGELFEGRRRVAVPQQTMVRTAVGVGLLAAGILLAVINAADTAPVLGPVTVIGWAVATALVWVGGSAVRERSALRIFHEEVSHARLMAENRAFAAWQETLLDRPSDAQMATWLDYDKAYIKSIAMRHFGLANRDLIAHVILTGPARHSYGARVPFGPPRYSDYVVQVFLLANSGVRQFAVHLKMSTGAVTSEQRRVFRYEAISSADAEEVCIRIDGERRETVDVEDAMRRDPSEKLVFSQHFRLNLNNTQSIDVLVGNVDQGLLDRVREDARHLLELTRDTSGVNSAIRILEAIAAEGSDWVQQERLRRGRRILDYQRKRNTVRAIGSGPVVPTPGTVTPQLPAGSHRPYRELPR